MILLTWLQAMVQTSLLKRFLNQLPVFSKEKLISVQPAEKESDSLDSIGQGNNLGDSGSPLIEKINGKQNEWMLST